MKPFFSNKVGDNERISLIEVKKVVPEDREFAETFKSYFKTIVKNKGINSEFISEEPVSNELVNDIIWKFQNRPSKMKINENHPGHFRFLAVEVDDADREIDPLDASKAIQPNSIPIKIIKATVIFFINLLCIVLTKVSLLQGCLTFSKCRG